MKPERRFGLDELVRQKETLEEAKKPQPQPQDGFSNLGRALVNLPWVLLFVAIGIWWWRS
jgi:hypothetical protein